MISITPNFNILGNMFLSLTMASTETQTLFRSQDWHLNFGSLTLHFSSQNWFVAWLLKLIVWFLTKLPWARKKGEPSFQHPWCSPQAAIPLLLPLKHHLPSSTSCCPFRELPIHGALFPSLTLARKPQLGLFNMPQISLSSEKRLLFPVH